MTSRIGIQLKPDHPVFWRYNRLGGYEKTAPGPDQDFLALQHFGRAYGFTAHQAVDMYQHGQIELVTQEDGSLMVQFVSETLTVEEAAAALRAMGRLGL